MEGGVLRQSSRKAQFVAPASAPPVPTASVLPSQGDTSSGTPLPTPSLLTDIDSSMGGDSPRPGGSAEHDSTFARMQNYNPYFPKFPPRQSSLVLSPTALQDGRGPQSPHDMDWLHSPPHNTLSKPAPPVDVSALQIKPVIALAMPDSSNSDSGSASMPSENPAKSTKTSTAQRSTGTRRSTPAGSSNGDDEEDEEDAYGGQSLSSDEYYTSSEDDGDVDEESEDDDVPLAETHPDALDVQKSLRAKVKRDQAKKKKRTIKAGEPKDVAIQDQQIPHREVQNPQNIPLDRALSKKATMSQTSAQAANKRNPFGFAPDELSEKLRHLDASHGRLNSLCHPPKRPDSAGERPHDLLLPQTDEHIKLRNSTKGRTNLAPPLAPFVQDSVLTMSEGSESEDVAPLRIKKKSQTTPLPPSVPSSHTMARHAHSEAPSIPASPKSPSLKQIDQSFSSLHENTNDHRSAAPGHQHHHHHGRPSFRSVQRVYINDPQHHCSVEVDENMTAAMLLAHLRAKGAISSNPAWSVTEVWRAMGVERPLREYELLQESIESWSSEANSSLLLVKKSPLAPLLSSLSKMRSDSETTGGWAYLEVKHGKWSKRYLEVRNGAMYIGKSEKVGYMSSLPDNELSLINFALDFSNAISLSSAISPTSMHILCLKRVLRK